MYILIHIFCFGYWSHFSVLWFHCTCGELVVQQQGRFSTQLSTEQTARLHWKGVVVTHQQAVDAEERFCGVSQEGRLVGHTVVHVHFVPLNAGKSSEKLHFCPWHYFVTANVSIKHSLYSLFDHNAKHKITISQRNANNANCDVLTPLNTDLLCSQWKRTTLSAVLESVGSLTSENPMNGFSSWFKNVLFIFYLFTWIHYNFF